MDFRTGNEAAMGLEEATADAIQSTGEHPGESAPARKAGKKPAAKRGKAA